VEIRGWRGKQRLRQKAEAGEASRDLRGNQRLERLEASIQRWRLHAGAGRVHGGRADHVQHHKEHYGAIG
jgi:hypothetical protein